MTTTFSWNIAQTEYETATGIVETVHYTVDAKDDVYSAGAYGSLGLERPAEGDTVVAFADLTTDVVIGWVKDRLGEEQVEAVEAALQKQLDEQRQPSRASGLPPRMRPTPPTPPTPPAGGGGRP